MPYAERHEIYLLVLEADVPLFEFVGSTMHLVVTSEKYRTPVRDILWHQLALPKWLEDNHIDVLHVPSYRRMLRSAPCALVATIHDLAQFHVRRKADYARMFYSRVVARYLARRQNEIITVSQSTAQDVERLFNIPRDRIHLAYNGVDRDRFVRGDQVQARAQSSARWALDHPFVLYVSRIEHPLKNHCRLIKAFEKFKIATKADWQLVLVGSDWHGSDVVHAVAGRSLFANSIRFLGFVKDADLPTLYRAAEAMVYPSLFEGFGLPLVEAIECGCPVLASNRGSLAEVVGTIEGTFDPENVDEIVRVLILVATDVGWRKRICDAQVSNAKRFSWDDHAQRGLVIYQRAIDRHREAVTPSIPR